MAPINLPDGESGGLEHTAFFEAEKPMIAFNADVCTVEVDIETGQFEILTLDHLGGRGADHQPPDRRGADAGRDRPGAVEHHVRGVRLRRERTAAHRRLRELQARDGGGRAGHQGDARADALPLHAAWAAGASARGGRPTCRARSATPSATRSAPSISRSRTCRSGRIRSGARSRRRARPPDPHPRHGAPVEARWQARGCASAPARASPATAGNLRSSWSSGAVSTTSPSSAWPSAPSRARRSACGGGRGAATTPSLRTACAPCCRRPPRRA